MQRWMILGIAATFAGLTVNTAHPNRSRTMHVQTARTNLRAAPNYFGTVIGELHYTDAVVVLATEGGWSHVRDALQRSGWINSSALTRTALVLRATGEDADTGVSSEEQTLAGRGFNPQVESAFRNRNVSADYDAVDRLETHRVSAHQALSFLAAGGVRPGGAR